MQYGVNIKKMQYICSNKVYSVFKAALNNYLQYSCISNGFQWNKYQGLMYHVIWHVSLYQGTM